MIYANSLSRDEKCSKELVGNIQYGVSDLQNIPKADDGDYRLEVSAAHLLKSKGEKSIMLPQSGFL